ncbi:MAG: substrate-binding domain-containing protein [Candidatus Hydrogenedens sp.]|nr:substrate-binding domain-containing protein [Candidatus Hydrogenedens sp.]
MLKRGMLAAVCVATVVLGGCGGQQPQQTAEGGGAAPAEKPIRLTYVTNGVDPFWDIAAAGVRAAEKDLGVECEVLMPPKGLADQQRMMEASLARGTDGLAISPIDAANQVGFINQASKQTKVITQDSDAPDSDRLCFIGMDNYKAGRAAGKLVKEAIPDGGGVMIFVGRLEQLNARQRRQGVIDELLDKPIPDEVEFDAPDATHLGGKYEILGTRTDNFDYAKAKSNAEDAIASQPNLKCMVGLFAYNPPQMLAAVKEAGKLDSIKLVGFDEQNDTLIGIRDGHIQGTISQQPFQYGYKSIEILLALAKGDTSVIPEDKFIDVPMTVVKQDNVEEFMVELERLRALGKQS